MNRERESEFFILVPLELPIFLAVLFFPIWGPYLYIKWLVFGDSAQRLFIIGGTLLFWLWNADTERIARCRDAGWKYQRARWAKGLYAPYKCPNPTLADYLPGHKGPVTVIPREPRKLKYENSF